MKDKEKIKQLEQEIEKHRDAYYNDEQEIPDFDYDKLESELKELDPKNKVLKKIGSSRKPSPWQKAEHHMKMGSLDKLKDHNTYKDLYRKIKTDWYVQELKLDGLSVEIVYIQGMFVKAITRGDDGVSGEDITRNVMKMKNVRPVIHDKRSLSLRAEIMLFESDFQMVNEARVKDGDKPFINARNGAGGLARKLDGTYSEYDTLLYYDIFYHDIANPFKTEMEKMQKIESFGLETSPYKLVYINDVEQAYKDELIVRISLPYDIDGLVYKMNDLVKADEIESDQDKDDNPKTQIAWKFPASQIACIMNAVNWSVSGSRITPVGGLIPTHIILPDGTQKEITNVQQLIKQMGVRIANVTLNNLEWISEKGLGLNDIVLIERANDVIPKLINVIKSSGEKIQIPDTCPCCGGKTEIKGKFLLCSNPKCPEKTLDVLLKWVEVHKIMGLGSGILTKMVENNLISEPADFYKLQWNRIASIDGLGDKTAEKVSIQFKTEITLQQLIEGLSIDNIGGSIIEKIIESGFDTIDKLFAITIDDIVNIEGCGEKTAEFFIDGLKSRKDMVINLLKVVVITEANENLSDALHGKTFCITGTLSRKRGDVEEIIKQNGGKLASVSKKLDYLVVGMDAGSKQAKAEQMGVKCISESDLIKMIG